MPDKVKELEKAWQLQTDSFTELAMKTIDEQPQAKAKGIANAKKEKKK